MVVTHYIDHHSLPTKPSDKLRRRVESVADHLESRSIIGKQALKPIRMIIQDTKGLFGIHALHEISHNRYMHPAAPELRAYWNRMTTFLETALNESSNE